MWFKASYLLISSEIPSLYVYDYMYYYELVYLIFPLKSETSDYELAVFIYHIWMGYPCTIKVSGPSWVLWKKNSYMERVA